jgi:hypothetical protein
LSLTETAAQLAMWQRHPQAPLWHEAVEDVFTSLWSRAAGVATLSVSSDGVQLLRQRFEQGLSRHPNRGNPFLWRLLH